MSMITPKYSLLINRFTIPIGFLLCARTCESFSFTHHWTLSRQTPNGESVLSQNCFHKIQQRDLSVQASLEKSYDDEIEHYHYVGGIECVTVPIQLPVWKESFASSLSSSPSPTIISVLEATANAQDVLVNVALQEETNQLPDEIQLPTGDPYGCVLWPAASAVSAYLLQHADRLLHGQFVVEVGTGTGLVSMAAAIGGASQVLATDYEDIPLQMLSYAVQHLNHDALQGKASVIDVSHFDLCDSRQVLPRNGTVLVAADIMYEPKTGRAMAARCAEALRLGYRVVVGDSPGRAGRPAFLEELRHLGVPESAAFIDVPGYTVAGQRNDLICGKGSTSVSTTPKPLNIAILELDPQMHALVK